ncbi:MAG: alr0857 family protein [Cyanophyceae cyanobacterium]
MLKLNYTEVGLFMERVVTSPEMVITQRVLLAVRLGQALYVEPGCASFLLPGDIPELEQLEMRLQREGSLLTVMAVDDELVEVNLHGSWLAESSDALEGTFLAVLSDRTEFLLYKLWQRHEASLSSLA